MIWREYKGNVIPMYIMSESIASRILERREIKDRVGRVGGDAHKKLVLRRIKEVRIRKQNAKMKQQC